jgi:putative spermidine/putrescine transport system ATP-binding protein
MLAVRPERITVDSPGDYALVARLCDAVFQGSKVQLHFETQGSDQLMVETADLSDGLPVPGTEMKLGWAVADTLIYPAP